MEQRGKQRVELKTKPAPPSPHNLVEDLWDINFNGPAEMNVKIFKHDGMNVGKVKDFKSSAPGSDRPFASDPLQIDLNFFRSQHLQTIGTFQRHAIISHTNPNRHSIRPFEG